MSDQKNKDDKAAKKVADLKAKVEVKKLRDSAKAEDRKAVADEQTEAEAIDAYVAGDGLAGLDAENDQIVYSDESDFTKIVNSTSGNVTDEAIEESIEWSELAGLGGMNENGVPISISVNGNVTIPQLEDEKKDASKEAAKVVIQFPDFKQKIKDDRDDIDIQISGAPNDAPKVKYDSLKDEVVLSQFAKIEKQILACTIIAQKKILSPKYAALKLQIEKRKLDQ
jgi:hypothetical protein